MNVKIIIKNKMKVLCYQNLNKLNKNSYELPLIDIKLVIAEKTKKFK